MNEQIPFPKPIQIRVEDEFAEGGQHLVPAMLVGENIAFSLDRDHLEIHRVHGQSAGEVYELFGTMEPLPLEIGQVYKFDEIVQDATRLTFAEFVGKFVSLFL